MNARSEPEVNGSGYQFERIEQVRAELKYNGLELAALGISIRTTTR
jgi:hypothetical protein